MAGMSLGQAMQRRYELEQEKLSMGRQKLNDDYELGKMQIGASLNRGGTQPAQSSSMNNIAQINSNASTAAAGAFNAAYQKPTSAISNPSPGVFGDIGSMNSFEDMQKPPAYKRGTTRVKDKTGKGNPKKDTVPAMLAQDEAVLNAGAARILGRKRIADLNAQGLSSMGMQGAKTEMKSGKLHASAGFLPEDERVNKMKARYGMIDSPPASLSSSGYDAGKVLQAIGMDPVGAAEPVARSIGSLSEVVKRPIVSTEVPAPPKRSLASQSMTPGDAMRLRRPAEPQYNRQVAVPGGYVQPKVVDLAAQAAELDAKSRQYVEGPLSGRTTDLSNADFAAQGMGDIAKIVGKDGKTTYTNIGNRNPYNNAEAQARTVGYKAGEKARAESVAEQTATPADLERQSAQFAMGQGRKLADLQQQFVAEQDGTKRATIAENIGMMSGKDRKAPDRRNPILIPFEEPIQEIGEDGKPVYGEATRKFGKVYDPETNKLFDPTAQTQPKPEDIIKAAFKSGKISREEARKQLIAIGME